MTEFRQGCTNCTIELLKVFDAFNDPAALLETISDAGGKPAGVNLIKVNDAFKTIFEPDSRNLAENTLDKIFPFQDTNWGAVFSKAAVSGQPIRLDYPGTISGKAYRMTIVKVAEQKLLLSLKDVTLEKKAHEMDQIHQILFENAQDIILYIRMDGTVANANHYAIEKYGYSKDEILTKKIQDIRHPSTMGVFESQMLQADREGILFESVHVKKDGSCFPVEVSAKSTDTAGGRLRIHIIRDITERKINEEKIVRLANFDSLTGISNRANLLNQLTYAIEYAKRNNLKIAVLLFDVDHFKSINDRFGHATGDAVLKYVAEKAKSVLRNVDIIGRLGGDEFIIVQTDVNDVKDISVLADRVIEAVKKPLPYNGHELSVSISIGISIYPSDSLDEKELLHLADKAMYEAKQLGGGKYHYKR